MDSNIILVIVFVILSLVSFGFAMYVFWKDQLEPDSTRLEETIDMADSTRQMPEINEGMEIPEEDKQYLQPVTVEILKKLAFIKRSIPTNAMLVEHLAESLAEAAKSFEARSGRQDPPQTGNENWLFVAAFAIRLYMEGSAHNCKEALDAFVTDGHLASRRLEKWAKQINRQISEKARDETVGDQGVRDITQHARTVGDTPYTQDEIEDMKDAADRGESGADSAFQQSLRNSKDQDDGKESNWIDLHL